MDLEQIKRIIHNGSEDEQITLRDYFKKYGNTYDKEVEVHEILVDTILNLNKEEIIKLSGIIGYPVFLRICLIPKIRHRFPLLQDGASLILFDEKERVLTQQRMDNGKYGFSGGCQELGEDLTEVAIRECYEEAGLLLDRNKIIDLCQVSGLSRRNSYPNGDVVVNNTAVHIGRLEDCTGKLRKDFESKKVEFNHIEYLDNLPEELKHEKDFIEICKMYLAGEKPFIRQEKIKMEELPEQGEMSFEDYLYSLTPEQALVLAKKMGYVNFLMAAIDERVRKLFPHLVDKSILVAMRDNEILVEERDGKVRIPKRIQSVGESFEDVLADSFKLNNDNLRLSVRMSGEETYDRDENVFINAMIFEPVEIIEENEYLRYRSVYEIEDSLDNEDKKYLEAVRKRQNKERVLKK